MRIILVSIVLLFACVDSKDDVFSYYGKEINHNVTLEDYNILIPSDSIDFPKTMILPNSMVAIGDNLLFSDYRSEYILHLYDPNKEEVKSTFLKRGEGPKEASDLLGVSITDDNRIVGVDSRTRDILVFSERNGSKDGIGLIARLNNPFDSKPTKVLSKGHNLIGAMRGSHTVVRFDTIQDLQLGLSEPLSLNDDLDPSVVNNAFFQTGALQLGSNENVFYFHKYAPIYQKLSLDNGNINGIVDMVDEAWDIEYKLYDHGIGAVLQTKIGFIDSSSDDNYVYALYSGDVIVPTPGISRQGNFLLKIDGRTGELIKTFKYDEGLSRITIVNEKLYAYNLNKSEKIYIFDINW